MTTSVEFYAESDFLLVILVRIVNSNDLRVGLTVQTHGATISGILTGGREYANGVAEQVRSVGGNVTETVAGIWDTLASEFYPAHPVDTVEDPDPEYLHLKDALLFAPGARPTSVGWWRGRIRRIDGWALGNFNAE
jgi:hypothetical protein